MKFAQIERYWNSQYWEMFRVLSKRNEGTFHLADTIFLGLLGLPVGQFIHIFQCFEALFLFLFLESFSVNNKKFTFSNLWSQWIFVSEFYINALSEQLPVAHKIYQFSRLHHSRGLQHCMECSKRWHDRQPSVAYCCVTTPIGAFIAEWTPFFAYCSHISHSASFVVNIKKRAHSPLKQSTMK